MDALEVATFSRSQYEGRSVFLTRVYALFIASLFAAAGGVWLGMGSETVAANHGPFVLFEFFLLFMALAVRKTPVLNLFALLAFCGVGGVTLSPLFGMIIDAGQGALLLNTFALTIALFSALSAYVFVTRQDFSFLGSFLFFSLWILIFYGFYGILVPESMSWAFYHGSGLMVFSGFMLYDTSQILLHCPDDEYVCAAIDLYLNFVNMFLDILGILDHVGLDIDI